MLTTLDQIEAELTAIRETLDSLSNSSDHSPEEA